MDHMKEDKEISANKEDNLEKEKEIREQEIRVKTEEDKIDNSIEEKAEDKPKEKPDFKPYIWVASSLILFVLLMVSVFTQGFGITGRVVSDIPKNEFIFMDSEKCTTACEAMEPFAKEIAENAGLEFKRVRFTQPAQIPGYILIYDNKLTINGIQDKTSLTKQVCDITANENICKDAGIAEQEAETESKRTFEQKCEELENVEKPKLEVFYVSRCPYGVQAINSLYYVAKNFGDKVEIIPRLLVNKAADGKSTTSMHGEAEHKEDLRQICIREEQPEVYWNYIHCYAESGNSEGCEETANIDSDKLADCYESRAEEYALNDADDWEKIYIQAGGRGSPSFFLNGKKINEYEFSSNGRSPESLKNIICCSSKEKIPECDNKLQTEQPPIGFGKIEQGSDEGTEELNC